MRTLDTRPGRNDSGGQAGADAGGPEPVMPSGTAVALEAAGTGLVVVALVVLLAWATDSRSAASTGDALRVAGQGWLLAHQVPLGVEGGRVGLVPGGLALLPVLLLARAGAALARLGAVAHPRDLGPVTACLALPYAACAGVVALLARTETVTPSPVLAALAAGVLALLAGGAGVAVRAGLLPGAAARLRPRLREALRSGLLAVAAVLGAGALLAGGALALALGEATALARDVAPGLGGAVGLALLGLAVVPNAVVWTASYLAGPGVALGAGTSVTVLGTSVAHVPALPLLAALPDPGQAPLAAPLLLLVPVAAGALAARSLRRREPGLAVGEQRRGAAGAAVTAGLVLAVLALLSGGPVGPGLTPVGPSAWQLGLAAAAEVAVGALLVVEAAAWRSRRRLRRTEGGNAPVASDDEPGPGRVPPSGAAPAVSSASDVEAR